MVGRKVNDYTLTGRHADIPATISTGWYDASPMPTPSTTERCAAQNTAPPRLIVGPWSHVGMRGDASFMPRRRFGRGGALGDGRYFDEQLAFFDRWLPDGAARTARRARRRCGIFVMGGGSGRRTAAGKLDHGGRWREEWRVAARPRRADDLLPQSDGTLAADAPGRGRAAPVPL